MTPDDAAKITHMTTVPTASPPGSRRVQRCTASNSFSAIPETLEHRSHEDEHRHGRENEIRGDGVDLLGELEDDRGIEGQIPEHQGDAHHGKGHVEAQEQCQQQHRKHHQGEIFTHRVPAARSSARSGGGCI